MYPKWLSNEQKNIVGFQGETREKKKIFPSPNELRQIMNL